MLLQKMLSISDIIRNSRRFQRKTANRGGISNGERRERNERDWN